MIDRVYSADREGLNRPMGPMRVSEQPEAAAPPAVSYALNRLHEITERQELLLVALRERLVTVLSPTPARVGCGSDPAKNTPRSPMAESLASVCGRMDRTNEALAEIIAEIEL